MNWQEQIELNTKHSKDPQPGDYWEDHLVGVLQVVTVTHGMVIFFDQKIQDERGWNWDMAKPRALTVPEFTKFLQYTHQPAGSEKTWACVHPNRKI